MNSKPITLTNLTPHQVDLLDHMWNLESMQEVEEWQSTLSASDRVMSDTLMRMVLHEVVEDLVVEDLSLAREYLTRFRL
jgi:hypothetical protein